MRISRSRKCKKSASKFTVPWWVLMGGWWLVSGAIWLFSAELHLPGMTNDSDLRKIDTFLHTPNVIYWSGWGAIAYGFWVAAPAWWRGRTRRHLLDRQRDLESLTAMTWQEFERLVGECYKRHGYQVQETGQGGADGGVDLLIKRGNEKILVQCKQWKKTSVGAPVVREMFGLMTHHKAHRVKIVCCGRFTRDAIAFAVGKPIDLVNGEALLKLVFDVQK